MEILFDRAGIKKRDATTRLVLLHKAGTWSSTPNSAETCGDILQVTIVSTISLSSIID